MQPMQVARVSTLPFPEAAVELHPDGRIATVTVEAEQLLGYRAADLIGQPVTVILPASADVARAAGAEDLGETLRAAAGAGWRRRDGTRFSPPASYSVAWTPARSSRTSAPVTRYPLAHRCCDAVSTEPATTGPNSGVSTSAKLTNGTNSMTVMPTTARHVRREAPRPTAAIATPVSATTDKIAHRPAPSCVGICGSRAAARVAAQTNLRSPAVRSEVRATRRW